MSNYLHTTKLVCYTEYNSYINISMFEVGSKVCVRLVHGLISSVIKWTEAPTTVIPIIQKLLKGGLRIWLYRYYVIKTYYKLYRKKYS